VIPKDPAYEARVRESFSRQSHMATLGAEIVFIAGYAAYTLAPLDTDVLAAEFKINLLAPPRALIATMLSTIIVRPRNSAHK
jgi:hypothetical protein